MLLFITVVWFSISLIGSAHPLAPSRAKLTMWPSLFVSLSVSWCLWGLLLRVSPPSLTPCMLLCLFLINLWDVCVSLCMCVGCSPALFPGGKWKHNPLEFNQTGLKKASIHKAIKVTNCMITVFTLTAQKQQRNTVTSSLTHCVAKSGSLPSIAELLPQLDGDFHSRWSTWDFFFSCGRTSQHRF